MISDDRLRNTRAWAAARVGTLSGAEVIVGAIDELLERRLHDEDSVEFQQIGVLRPDGEMTTADGVDGDPVYLRKVPQSNTALTCKHGVAGGCSLCGNVR